jgi:uncharacterized protein (DUF433 family)
MASLDWSQCPAVESIPGKVSGAWVLRGTRTPVKVLFENLEAGMSIEEVIEQFPVSREQIDSLMAFVARSLEQQAPRIDESHCNKCGGTRRISSVVSTSLMATMMKFLGLKPCRSLSAVGVPSFRSESDPGFPSGIR